MKAKVSCFVFLHEHLVLVFGFCETFDYLCMVFQKETGLRGTVLYYILIYKPAGTLRVV